MRIAAIDVGSNSVHMIVCRVRPDASFEVIDREKDMIRLGAGTLEHGRLPESNLAAALASLGKFRRLAESASTKPSSLAQPSQADNGDLITDARWQLGLRLRAPRVERRGSSIRGRLCDRHGPARSAVVDVGGGKG
jgi:exopolyphosphatase/guanosine-5'-triphosphate,3'-diphosphate pyrophosphatase